LVLSATIWKSFIFCQFFLRTLKKLFAPWHVGIHHFKLLYKNWRKFTLEFTFKEFIILTIWRTCKWCWSSQYLNFFLELKVWECISHCRESIGCNMDLYFILIPLHLKYLLNWTMCSFIIYNHIMHFYVQFFGTKTRLHTTNNKSKKSKKFKTIIVHIIKKWMYMPWIQCDAVKCSLYCNYRGLYSRCSWSLKALRWQSGGWKEFVFCHLWCSESFIPLWMFLVY